MNFQVSKEKCSFLLYTIWRNSKFSCPVRFGVTMVIARRFTLLIATVGSNCQEKAVLAKLLNRLPVKVGARLWLSFKQISRRPFFFFLPQLGADSELFSYRLFRSPRFFGVNVQEFVRLTF